MTKKRARTDCRCDPLKYSDQRMRQLLAHSEEIWALETPQERTTHRLYVLDQNGREVDAHGYTIRKSWIDPRDLQHTPDFWKQAIALRAQDVGCEPKRGQCVRKRT